MDGKPIFLKLGDLSSHWFSEVREDAWAAAKSRFNKMFWEFFPPLHLYQCEWKLKAEFQNHLKQTVIVMYQFWNLKIMNEKNERKRKEITLA